MLNVVTSTSVGSLLMGKIILLQRSISVEYSTVKDDGVGDAVGGVAALLPIIRRKSLLKNRRNPNKPAREASVPDDSDIFSSTHCHKMRYAIYTDN